MKEFILSHMFFLNHLTHTAAVLSAFLCLITIVLIIWTYTCKFLTIRNARRMISDELDQLLLELDASRDSIIAQLNSSVPSDPLHAELLEKLFGDHTEYDDCYDMYNLKDTQIDRGTFSPELSAICLKASRYSQLFWLTFSLSSCFIAFKLTLMNSNSLFIGMLIYFLFTALTCCLQLKKSFLKEYEPDATEPAAHCYIEKQTYNYCTRLLIASFIICLLLNILLL